MIILSILSLLISFTSSTPAVDVTCNQLIEAFSDYEKGTITYCNKYKIPVVDSAGKMMFDVGLQQRGSVTRLSMTPAMDCRIKPNTSVAITFADRAEFVVETNHDGTSGKIDIMINEKLRSKMMTTNIYSIAFGGRKYPYNVIFKKNQGRVILDVMNCLQH